MNTEPTTVRDRYLERVQAYIAKMPSLSTTALKVLETCNDPQASANDLKRVISLDPVLTARVLKLINSAYYSLSIPVTSLTRAIVMLGLNTVKNLALSVAILDNFKHNESNAVFSPDEFWMHSLCVGVIAKNIADFKMKASKSLEAFFVAGLLHDLGKIPLNRQFPSEYRRVWKLAEDRQINLRHSENQHLGIDHCTVGSMIAKKWCLGTTLIEALSCHHDPDDSSEVDRDFVYIVSLANQFANYLNIGSAGDCTSDHSLISYLGDNLGVDWKMLNGLGETVLNEIEKAKIFLEIARKG
jgi:HD-like signal output (HDOD) protein